MDKSEIKHLVALTETQWGIVKEAVYLYMHVNRWKDQGHNPFDIEEVLDNIYSELEN